MIRRAFRYRALVAASVILTAVQCVMKLRLPRLMSYAVNTGLQHKDLSLLKAVGLNMLITCILMGISGYCANLFSAVSGQRFALELRREAYRRISNLSVSQVYRLGTGSLITRLTTDIDICAMLIHAMILLVIEPVLMTIGGVWMMWMIGPAFGAVFVGFVAIQLFVMVIFIWKTAPGFMRVRTEMDTMNRGLQNTFGIFRLIRSSGTQSRESGSFDVLNTDFFRRSYEVQKLVAFFNPFIMLTMNLSVAAVLFLSGWEVSSGRLNIGMLLMAISYSEQVLMSIMTGGQMYRMITETQPSARRILQILETDPDLVDSAESESAGPFRELVFDSVRFEYPEGGKVLDGLSFSIRRGETKAVIGPVGSGKSTMAALCARLYDVTGGRILVNGRDIRSLRQEDLRRTVALVEKHPALLRDTLRENIVFGRENISEEEIRKAASAARFTLPPEQESGIAGQSAVSAGRKFSGGETQRLGITRALAGNPGLLVLDESTSALDYETEKELLSAVRREYPDLAILFITSRLPSARRANDILVLEGGKAAAEGEDRVLRARCELYRRMTEIQNSEATDFHRRGA